MLLQWEQEEFPTSQKFEIRIHKEHGKDKSHLYPCLAIPFIYGKALMDFISSGLDAEHRLICLLHYTSLSINLTFEAKHIDSW